MDFYGTKKDGKMVYPPAVAEKKRRYWNNVPEGATVKSSLVVPRKAKSYDQLEMIWGLMIAKAVILLEDGGFDTSYIYNLDKPTGNAIKERPLCNYLYEVCPIYNEDGKRITLSGSDTKQASQFFEECRNHLASKFGIVIQDPDPNWKDKK